MEENDVGGVVKSAAPLVKKALPGPVVGTEVASAPFVKNWVVAGASCAGVVYGVLLDAAPCV
jgi:hypothetical protein